MAVSDVKKLQEAGVHTVEGLAHASRKYLQTIKGLSEQKVEKLKGIGACACFDVVSRRARTRGATRERARRRRARRRGVPGLKASTGSVARARILD